MTLALFIASAVASASVDCIAKTGLGDWNQFCSTLDETNCTGGGAIYCNWVGVPEVIVPEVIVPEVIVPEVPVVVPPVEGSATCVVKPESGDFSAFCIDADEASCKIYDAYCTWGVTEGSSSNEGVPTGPPPAATEASTTSTPKAPEVPQVPNPPPSTGGSGTKCVAAPGFETYQAWCSGYTAFGADTCNNATSNFCLWD